jgi:hypothetical protein
MEAPPVNDKEDGKKGKKSKKAAKDEGDEDEEDEEKDSDEGDEDEEKQDKEEKDEQEREDKQDKKKGKKAAAGLNDMQAQAVRLEERLRCAKIFQSKASAGRPDLAARFAFHTNLAAEEAILLMEGFQPVEQASASRRVSIDERMAKVPSANVGSDAEESQDMRGLSEAQLAKMSPAQRAQAILKVTQRA